MGSSSSSSGDDNDAELSIDSETDIALEVMESSAATVVPKAKVVHQKLAAKASFSLFKFMKSLNDCTDAEIDRMKQMKDAKSFKFAAENASNKVCITASATEKQQRVTEQKMDVGI